MRRRQWRATQALKPKPKPKPMPMPKPVRRFDGDLRQGYLGVEGYVSQVLKMSREYQLFTDLYIGGCPATSPHRSRIWKHAWREYS